MQRGEEEGGHADSIWIIRKQRDRLESPCWQQAGGTAHNRCVYTI